MFRQFVWDLYKKLETSEHRLLYLFLEVTRACNLACLHCGSDCGADGAEDCGAEDRASRLTPDDWFALVDAVSARYSPELMFVITGGEPLLWPSLEELGRRIVTRGRRWGLVTNGFALDERRLTGLVASGLESVTVSLDGDAAAHNRLRGNREAYERALRAIRLVGASPIRFRDVVTCVHPANALKLDSIAETLIDAGIPAWRLFRIFPLGRARNNPGLVLDRKASLALVEWIRANRPAYAKRGLAVDFSCEGFFPFSLDRKIRREPFFCRSGINIAAIRCDGIITGCANNGPAFFEGSVLTDDFAEVWEKGFRRLRDREWMRTGLCAGCRHFNHCQGGSAHLWDAEASSPAFCYLRG